MIERLKKNKSAFIKRTKIHPIEVRMKKWKKKSQFPGEVICISNSKSLFLLTMNYSDLVVETWHSWTQKNQSEWCWASKSLFWWTFAQNAQICIRLPLFTDSAFRVSICNLLFNYQLPLALIQKIISILRLHDPENTPYKWLLRQCSQGESYGRCNPCSCPHLD